MTKQLIIQSIKIKELSLFVDFECNGVWCKAVINSSRYIKYLCEECKIFICIGNLTDLYNNYGLLERYIFNALNDTKRPLTYVILEEYHLDEGDVLELIHGLQISLSK